MHRSIDEVIMVRVVEMDQGLDINYFIFDGHLYALSFWKSSFLFS